MPRMRPDKRNEVAARQVLEREGTHAVVLDESMSLDDVTVPSGREHFVLALEPRARVMRLRSGERNLERYATAPYVECAPDLGAAARADPLDEAQARRRQRIAG